MTVRRHLAAAVALFALSVAPLRAQTSALSGVINADNSFWATLTTSPASPGVAVASGTDWTRTVGFSGLTLAPGQDYLFRVRVQDVGSISGLLATLSLSGSTHVFAGGGTTLLTGVSTGWLAGTTDFTVGPQSLVSYGLKGVAPWNNAPAGNTPTEWAAQSAAAQWVWTQDNCIHCTRYFTASIYAVPEPTSVALVASGLLALPLLRRRRRA